MYFDWLTQQDECLNVSNNNCNLQKGYILLKHWNVHKFISHCFIPLIPAKLSIHLCVETNVFQNECIDLMFIIKRLICLLCDASLFQTKRYADGRFLYGELLN